MDEANKYRFRVQDDDVGRRLDQFLSSHLSAYSRQFLVLQIKADRVKVNGIFINIPKTIVRLGQVIEIKIKKPETELTAEAIDLDILYQDQNIIVINKPAGMVVYPVGRYQRGTLANALKSRFKIFYLVHRLDRDTSGVIIVARSKRIKEFLSKLFKQREIKKVYIALLKGKIIPQQAYIDMPIKRGRSARFEVLPGGRQAESFYRVKKYLKGFSLVEIEPKSGRTHQIRVHFKALGHPLVGDRVYGIKEQGLERQFLHAYRLEFIDWAGKKRSFTAPLPNDLIKFLKYAER